MFLVIFCSFLFFFHRPLNAQNGRTNVINQRINAFVNSNPCPTIDPESTATAGIIPTGITPTRDHRHSISVISQERALEIFREQARDPAIPFRYPDDGCYARAHRMSQNLEAQGINTVKIFVEGRLQLNTSNSPQGFVRWQYHVAPAVCVRTTTGIQLMVIDPSLHQQPVTARDWLQLQTRHSEARIDLIYLTSRYVYGPPQFNAPPLPGFQQETLNHTATTFKNYIQALELRDRSFAIPFNPHDGVAR